MQATGFARRLDAENRCGDWILRNSRYCGANAPRLCRQYRAAAGREFGHRAGPPIQVDQAYIEVRHARASRQTAGWIKIRRAISTTGSSMPTMITPIVSVNASAKIGPGTRSQISTVNPTQWVRSLKSHAAECEAKEKFVIVLVHFIGPLVRYMFVT